MKRVCQNLEENWELRMLVLVYLSVNWDHVVIQGSRAGNCPPAGLQTVGCSQLQLVDYFSAWSWRASASWPVMVTLGLVRGLQVSEVGLYLSKLLARKKSPRYGCTIATWTEGPIELQSGRLHALRPVLIFYPERTAGSEWAYICKSERARASRRAETPNASDSKACCHLVFYWRFIQLLFQRFPQVQTRATCHRQKFHAMCPICSSCPHWCWGFTGLSLTGCSIEWHLSLLEATRC